MSTTALIDYAKYDSYKDSGINELGQIPERWELLSNKHIFSIKSSRVGKKSEDYDLLSLTLKGIVKRDMENPQGKFPAEFDTYQEVKAGDFVFCLFDVEETPRTVGLSEFDGMITGAYTVLEVSPDFDKTFIYYFYLNLDNEKKLKPLYRGLRNTIPKDWFMSYKTFIPTYKEQIAIANFLDQKTIQIDQAINLKQRQIEQLNEYKQIVIQNVVTKGLDANAKMKNSGIDWLGDIPEAWEIKKLKFLTSKIGSGVTPSGGGTTYIDNGVPLLRSQNIHFDRISLDNVARISEFVHNSMGNSKVQKGDVLLNITGGSLGRCYYNSLDIELNVNQHVCIIRPNEKVDSVFLNYLLASNIGQQQIWFFQQGGGREGLNFQNLKNFDFPLPSKSEQLVLVKYIDEQVNVINRAMNSQKEQIERLKEYKTILINQAVTGKIKVC
ncbi:restriction endonuclease subunit S [Psychrobacter piscatorii]|uniref:restriction endonuclease subunit S n=1 Tax=Psychrobacter piscatorii TaxID=554343 RepID=UPI00191ABD4E|nr:restriction endonuclease subunit S [Psychrobacter piscatorii]